jgi:hypothetical protein
MSSLAGLSLAIDPGVYRCIVPNGTLQVSISACMPIIGFFSPVRDDMLVESKIQRICNPVRDEIWLNHFLDNLMS